MFFQTSYFFVQHLWIQVGAPGGQTSFLTGFVTVYTERWQLKKPLKELPCHIPRLRCRRCHKQFGGWFTDEESGSGRSPWRRAEAEGSCPAQRIARPGGTASHPGTRHSVALDKATPMSHQLKTTWPHVGLRLPAEEQGSERRLGAARPASRCQAAGRQRERRRLPWSSGGDAG